jgi:hypothetical protein
MELSQLSVALPGTNQVCTVLGITNNLLSTLYSWQLVFTSKGLAPSSATGAVLLNSTGEAHYTTSTDVLMMMDKVTLVARRYHTPRVKSSGLTQHAKRIPQSLATALQEGMSCHQLGSSTSSVAALSGCGSIVARISKWRISTTCMPAVCQNTPALQLLCAETHLQDLVTAQCS